MSRLRGASDDAGFTLVELLVALAITSIITGVVGSALIVGTKTSVVAGTRLDESHDAELLTTYLTRDLQSVAEGGVDTSAGSASGCAAAGIEGSYTGWRNVLALTWSESIVGTPTKTFRAEYRLAQSVEGDKPWKLLRITCVDGAGTGAAVVAHQLTAPSGSGAAPSVVVDTTKLPTVLMTLTEPSGYTYTVSGMRRTPNSTALPAPVWECTILSAISKPEPATRATVSPGPLQDDLRIEVQSGGACGALKVVVQASTTARNVSLAESPAGSGQWAATLPKAADVWTDGAKSFPILNGSTTVATLNLTVKQACIPSAFTVAPSTVRRTDAAAPGPLQTGLTVSATTSGVCDQLAVDYAPNAAASSTLPLTETSPGNWSGSISATSDAWSDGGVALKLHESIGPVLATTTLTVTPSCQVAMSTATPNPVTRGNGQQKDQLASDVSVSVTTTGTCTGLSLRLSPGATPVAVPLSSSVADTWSATLSATAYSWTSGNKNVDVLDSYGAKVGSFNLGVI